MLLINNVLDLEVAERDAWKRDITLLGPVAALNQVPDHVEAERLVLGGQDEVQQEQLTNHVADVEDLRDEKQQNQIVVHSVYTVQRNHQMLCVQGER